MRTILIAVVAAVGIMTGTGHGSAAPGSGSVIDDAANAGLVIGQVDCRWYPHRHRNASPHGWGRGCAAKSKRPPAPKKK